MTKQEFLTALEKQLYGLPTEDREERLGFYGEMIDDRMEEGCAEADAVAAIGPVEEIAAQIIADTPLMKLAKERVKPKRRLRAWEIVLLAVGSPIWLSLGIAALAVVLSVYIVLWSAVVSLWAIFGALAACAPYGLVAGIALAFGGNGAAGIAVIGAGLVCAGLAILTFFGSNAATKGIVALTKRIPLFIKRCFLRKEEMQ